jgi:D-glycero-alpha-D-manno-heptose-7-phosphate kinase
LLRDRLGAGDAESLGELLHRNWELKRGLTSGITDETLDGWYESAMEAGATGGKLLGAGGGGFLLMSAPPAKHDAVRRALRDLREVPVRFSARGTHITVLTRDGL